jgi:glucose-6-phosphate 1-epimerase
VPVCFPQFASRGPLVKHGFARTQDWTAISVNPSDLHLRLVDTDSTRVLWPHAFQLDLRVQLETGQLTLQLQVTNTGSDSWSFMAALHTYLRVDDVTQARLGGLENAEFEDALEGGARQRAGEERPDLAVPIDRVYRGVARPLLLEAGHRRVRIAQDGFEDVVVWNPGLRGAAQLGDMPDQDAPHMLCVEAGRIVNPVTLQPGQRWRGTQQLTVE